GTSSPPSSATTRSTIEETEAASETSDSSTSARPPVFVMRRAISSARPPSRSTQATAAPAAARLGQIPCASPPPAPVTIATRPVRSKGLIGRPLAYERGGGEGEPGGSPSVSKKGAAWGKHGFPPRERAGGERRSRGRV